MTFFQQLLIFPFTHDYAPESFQVAPCNAMAFNAINSWPHWVDRLLLVHGPTFSGKTHLGHIWQQKTGADYVRITDAFSSNQALIIDGLTSSDLTLNLFHFINRVREEKRFCLILSDADPLLWPCPLADLTSRLKAIVSIGLEAPDDEHLAFLLQKNLSDQQIRLSQYKAHKLLLNSERSYEGVKKIFTDLMGDRFLNT